MTLNTCDDNMQSQRKLQIFDVGQNFGRHCSNDNIKQNIYLDYRNTSFDAYTTFSFHLFADCDALEVL